MQGKGPAAMPVDLRSAAEQLHDTLAAAIAAGELRDGHRLPSARQLGPQHGVSAATAARAVQWLATDGLVRTDHTGSYVRAGRYRPGVQQRLGWHAPAPGEYAEVTAAGWVDAPEYVVPLLGLERAPRNRLAPVIRREQVLYEHDGPPGEGQGGLPFALIVEWFPAQLTEPCPELLHQVPLDAPGGAPRLIEARTADPGRWAGPPVVLARGRTAWEARPAKDDGREMPLLDLPWGAHVAADVWMLFDAAGQCWVYGERVQPEGRVSEAEWAISPA